MDSINGFIWSKTPPQSDRFCWTCHKMEPTLFCTTCERSFHTSPRCSNAKKMSAEQMQIWRCFECTAIEGENEKMIEKKIDRGYLNKLLSFTCQLLLEDGWLTPVFENIEYSSEKVVKNIDLKTIAQKNRDNKYRSCEEFMADIKWIKHYAKALNPLKSFDVRATRWLMDFTGEEMFNIRLCHECYSNANQHPHNWLTMICSEPHLVVWVKLKPNPYWPAKLMAFDRNTNKIDVRFFGHQHRRAVVTPKDCIMYTEIDPNIDGNHQNEDFQFSRKQAKVYIENLMAKFGSFHYAKPNTQFDPAKFERHLYDMLPNVWRQLGKTEIPPPIPKPVPARRKSVAVFKSIDAQTSSEFYGSRRTTRSTSINTNENYCQQISSTSQRIATKTGLGSMAAPNLVKNAAYSMNAKKNPAKDFGSEQTSMECPSKRRKISIDSSTVTVPLKCVDHNIVGEKRLESVKSFELHSFNPLTSSYEDDLNDMNPSNGKTTEMNWLHQSSNTKKEQDSLNTIIKLEDQLNSLTKIKTKSESEPKSKDILSENVEYPTEIVSICKYFFDNSKNNENIRFNMMLDYLTKKEELKQKIESQIETQRIDYQRLIGKLEQKNRETNSKCAQLTISLNKQSEENKVKKREMEQLTAKLEAAHIEIDQLTTKLATANNQINQLNTDCNDAELRCANLNLELATVKMRNANAGRNKNSWETMPHFGKTNVNYAGPSNQMWKDKMQTKLEY